MHLTRSKSLAIALTVAGLFAPSVAQADAGHDHGAKLAVAADSAQPRFAVASDLFELVGVVSGTQLRLYLDRSTDNSPVIGARLELELGGAKIDIKPLADGEFEATLAEPLKGGILAVTATVFAGQESDLLAGEFEVRDPVQAAAAPTRHWLNIAGWATAVLLALVALGWLVRRLRGLRRARSGSAA